MALRARGMTIGLRAGAAGAGGVARARAATRAASGVLSIVASLQECDLLGQMFPGTQICDAVGDIHVDTRVRCAQDGARRPQQLTPRWMTMEIVDYLCNFSRRIDATIFYTGPKTVKADGIHQAIDVSICRMDGMTIQTRRFESMDTARAFARRELK